MRSKSVNRSAIQQNPIPKKKEADFFKTTILFTFIGMYLMWLFTVLVAALLDVKAYEFWLVMIMIGEALFGNKIIGLLIRNLRKWKK